jgi:hypothetical protein
MTTSHALRLPEWCFSDGLVQADESTRRHRALPRVDYAELRRDADELVHAADRSGDDAPWRRLRA